MQPIGQLNFLLINKLLWYDRDKDNGLVIWLWVKIHLNIHREKTWFIPFQSCIGVYFIVSITFRSELTVMIGDKASPTSAGQLNGKE